MSDETHELTQFVMDLRRAEKAVTRLTTERDAAVARAERAERERDAARADHAAAEDYLAGIVRRWEAADHDSQSLADLHVPGLRREIEEARDGRESEWWRKGHG